MPPPSLSSCRHHSRWFAWLAAGCLAAPFASDLRAADSAHAKGEVPGYIVVPLGRGHGNRLTLAATAEGTKGLMFVDTGASGTLLSQSKYGALLKEPNRKLPPGVPKMGSVNGMTVPVLVTKDCVLAGKDLGPLAARVVPQRSIYDPKALYDSGSDRQ